MKLINLTQRDDLFAIVRKCNINFKQISFEIQQETKKIATEAAASLAGVVNNLINDILPEKISDQLSILKYASSPVNAGNADCTNAILFGTVDSTSTSTVFTATVPGLTELVDGTCVMLKNGVVTSASGFTLNVNDLGAKPAYSNMASATRETTIFNVAYTMLFIYDENRVAGGAWVCYRGYDSNTNTIGYQLRTNSSTLPAQAKFYRYRLLFTSADGKKWVPANTSTSTNATSSRSVNQTPIDPFGSIVYYGTTTAIEANANVTAAQLWQQYTLTFGYSFNRTGAALTLAYPAPVYIKCAPQADGSAIIDDTTPYVQSLPSSEDGKIYIFLGIAYSATAVEMKIEHPVYEYKDGAIRQYVNKPTLPVGSYVMADSMPVHVGTVWQQAGSVTTDSNTTIPVWKRTA